MLSLNEEENFGLTSKRKYSQFLDIIIPKTRTLFKIISKYVTGKVSMVEIISYMEPFLVYSDDLTYMQYIDINKFIDDMISTFNKKFIEKRRQFVSLKTIIKERTLQYMNVNCNIITNTLNGLPDKKSAVLDAYDVNTSATLAITNSELLKKMILADYGNLYNTTIAMENLSLMFSNSLSPLFSEDKQNLKVQGDQLSEANKCASYVIAKKYMSEQEIEHDNGRDIYFDKEYDNTPYGILFQTKIRCSLISL